MPHPDHGCYQKASQARAALDDRLQPACAIAHDKRGLLVSLWTDRLYAIWA